MVSQPDMNDARHSVKPVDALFPRDETHKSSKLYMTAAFSCILHNHFPQAVSYQNALQSAAKLIVTTKTGCVGTPPKHRC